MPNLTKFHVSDLAMVVATFLLFVGSFHLNQSLDSFMLYAPGVSLIFIPAGVKLLAILVGRLPAMVGLFIASVYLSMALWTDLQTASLYFFAVASVFSYAIAANGVMKLLGIHRDLYNLGYWHIVVLSLAASVLNGFMHNVAYLMEGVTAIEAQLGNSAAMALGDFLGCFIVVSLFHTATLLLSKRPQG
jgi:glucose-6-phosphate-specific signal transduction histidine kinase